jgi:bifunctional UDP-N-acetylglucosamine pyrophosphorylase / glucosamine-1-phosphate N-acetyltransferase
MYAADSAALRRAIAHITPNNAQAEYYFTDVVASLAQSSRVSAVPGQIESMLGVNDRAELRAAEELMFERIRVRHAKNGVTVRGGARIDDSVEIGQDALIEASACLRGATRIGPHTTVDSGCVISDSVIGASVHVKPHSVIVESRVGDAAEIGPFSHMRPGSELEAEVHIGNFVETKKTHMGRGAKANHLSYLGDGDIGAGSNIGAGTIFCNYDGFQKHRTVIGEGVFIGSDSQLVAPVSVGDGAYVASGTAVTHDVPDGALAIGRVRQENKLGYGLRLRERLAALAREAKKR